MLNFRTSFVNKSGQVVYQARLIALNYIRGWFLLDLLAAIPFDFLYIFNINAVSWSLYYANMSVQYTAIFHGCKNDNFQMKIFDIFLIFAQNIDCG